MARVVRGSCNRCGECCGRTTQVPAFGWSFFEIILQTEGNLDFPLSELPQQEALWGWVNHCLDRRRRVKVGDSFHDWVLVKTGVGLVKSDTDYECPFLDASSPNSHSCLIWNEPEAAAFHDVLCKPTFPTEGFVIPENLRVDTYAQFFIDNPSCGFYINEE